MKSILLSWVGEHDIKSAKEKKLSGPIHALLRSEHNTFDEVHLLYSYPESLCNKYFERLSTKFTFIKEKIDLEDPMDFRIIYKEVKKILDSIKSEDPEINWSFHTSPGTPAMTAIWLLLGKTNYLANLFSSRLDGDKEVVRKLDIPFDINIDFIPEYKKKEAEELQSGWNDIPSFLNIIHNNQTMKDLLDQTFRIAKFDVPVLILGETGTGKEMFAKAIQEASFRKNEMFTAVNCGALPESLIETTLFGWSKGAFSDAVHEEKGLFEKCNGGTLFLDEIGDLSLNLQVKLLRVLQEKEFQRVGDNKTFKVDVRIITATNKDLAKMVVEKKFREDLFHRIAIGIIKLPPLRERGKDILLIAKNSLNKINKKFKEKAYIPDYVPKHFSDSGLKFIQNHQWPGNIRELHNAIKTSCIWTKKNIIDENDLRKTSIELTPYKQNKLVSIPQEGLDLKKHLLAIEREYAEAAIKREGSKAKASKLLKINPKTFEKRCKDILNL